MDVGFESSFPPGRRISALLHLRFSPHRMMPVHRGGFAIVKRPTRGTWGITFALDGVAPSHLGIGPRPVHQTLYALLVLS